MPKATPLPPKPGDPLPDRELYRQDEHEWIAARIAALTDGQLNRLDRANVSEPLTEMTIRDRRESRSRLHHLLNLQFQPGKLTSSWITTILEQGEIIDSTPGPGRQAEPLAASAHPDAVRRTGRDNGPPAVCVPATSPWTVEAALALDPPEPALGGQRH
jgi:hypothetical protein